MFDIIRHRRDAVITGIHELKNNQALIDHLLNNIINSSHGKPQVTCMSRQAQKRKRVWKTDSIVYHSSETLGWYFFENFGVRNIFFPFDVLFDNLAKSLLFCLM